MKRNIDITSTEIFSGGIHLNVSFHFGKDIFFPWDACDESCGSDIDRLLTLPIDVGDKWQRKMLRDCRDEESGKYCPRCGEYLQTIPWEMIGYGYLCHRCNKQMDDEYKRRKPLFSEPSVMEADRRRMYRIL